MLENMWFLFFSISRVMLFNTHLVDSFHLPANISGTLPQASARVFHCTQLQKVTNGYKWVKMSLRMSSKWAWACFCWHGDANLEEAPAKSFDIMPCSTLHDHSGYSRKTTSRIALKKKSRPKFHSETQKLLCGREVSNKKINKSNKSSRL